MNQSVPSIDCSVRAHRFRKELTAKTPVKVKCLKSCARNVGETDLGWEVRHACRLLLCSSAMSQSRFRIVSSHTLEEGSWVDRLLTAFHARKRHRLPRSSCIRSAGQPKRQRESFSPVWARARLQNRFVAVSLERRASLVFARLSRHSSRGHMFSGPFVCSIPSARIRLNSHHSIFFMTTHA